MKRKIITLLLACLLAMQLVLPCTYAENNVVSIVFDTGDFSEAEIYEKYKDMFNDQDVTLTVRGDNLDALLMLKRFHFRSLNLVIELVEEGENEIQFSKVLWFPSCLKSLVFIKNGEEVFPESELMDNLLISLADHCPDAIVGKSTAGELKNEIFAARSNNMLYQFDTTAKIEYVYDLLLNGQLEILSEEAKFSGKMIFLTEDGETNLNSSESLLFDEDFYGIPEKFLAKRFNDADTLVFIYPEYSYKGSYTNGAEAWAVYTKVSVVNLNTMTAYQAYTAYSDEPPKDLEISDLSENAAQEGYTGTFYPEKAIEQIASQLNDKNTADQAADKDKREQLLPWVLAEQAAASANEQEISSAESTEEQETLSAESTENTAEAELENEWLTEELLEKIFAALSDDSYKNTYEALKKVADLVYGSRGNAALGVQETLRAFGQDITADGSIGNSTLGALNRVQEAMGLETTQKISSKIYAQLMPALLLYLDETAAQELFADQLPQENEFAFMKAGAFYLKEAYFHAKEAYEKSRYGNYEEMAERCVVEMPETGEIYRNADIAEKSSSSLIVDVQTTDESSVTCVKVLTEDGVLMSCLLVRGSGTASTQLPAGNYKIIDGSGYRWYGVQDMFGSDGNYEQMVFADGVDHMEIQDGYDYTLTFQVTEHNDEGMDLGTEELNWLDLTE